VLIHKLIPLLALGLNLLLLGSALAADRKHHRNYVFAYLAMALSVWNLGVFGLRSAPDAATAMTWERVLHLGVILLPALFYHYVLAFLDLARASSPTLWLGYTLAAFFIGSSATPLFMAGVTKTYWGWAPSGGPLYGPFFVYVQAYLVLGLVQLIRAQRSSVSSFRRNRTNLVIAGVVVSILGGLVDFTRYVVGWERLYPIGIPSNALFALAMGLAIVRYRLLDVAVLVKRIVLYVFTSLSVAPFLMGGLYLIDRFTDADHFAPTLPVLAALLGGVMVGLPMLRMLERGLKHVMFARQDGVRDALVALSKDLGSVLDLEKLGTTLTQGLVTRVPAIHASLHLWSPEHDEFVLAARAVSPNADAPPTEVKVASMLTLWLRITGKPLGVEELAFQALADARLRTAMSELEAARVALLVPLFLEGELAAILVLGEKVSGEMYDGAEIELLEMLMGQSGITLKNSRLYADLRNQMDELTRTQQQLIQSAKLAAIGELAASVAHEINNPLTVVLGNTTLLRHVMPADSPAQEKLATIEAEAMRAGKITRDLLDFARRREPNREALALDDLIRKSADLLGLKLTKARVEVEMVFDPAVPWILGDADQLKQVFINLMGNAVDAMPDGGTLTVRTELMERARSVAVSIIDSGIGMTSDQLTRVFEPFYTTKAEGKGTGLGLSVSLGIVKNHNGTLEARSEPGKGTTMIVSLPLPTPKERAPRRPLARSRAA
jgi:signal transduction histidine kinase